MGPETFIYESRRAFAFLEEEHGFRAEADERHWAGPRLRYVSDSTFVAVELDERAHRFHVSLGPLVDGEVPPKPLHSSRREPIAWYPLWAMASARGESTPPFGFSARRERLRSELESWAGALRKHAGPALDGDFRDLWDAAAVLRMYAEWAAPEAVSRGAA